MAKKDFSNVGDSNKNLGGVDALFSGSKKETATPQSNTLSSGYDGARKYPTTNVKNYSLSLPNWMYDKLKFDLSKERGMNMRDLILNAIEQHYGIKEDE